MPEQILELRETIKLMKMSKGYQWEIKLLVQEPMTMLDSLDIDRLEELNNHMVKRFGNEELNKIQEKGREMK